MKILILEHKIDLSTENDALKDHRFTKWLIKHVGVLGIPPSVFFSEANASLMENCVRFCFFKKDETLKKAVTLLEQLSNI